ncbi:hypothetical protein EfmJHP36_12020 [Enterococcus faecium]|nr:hypothetical protein EfmJHP36_12020 [Enterococcus faecium]
MKENYDIIYNGSSGKGSHQTVWNLFSTVKELKLLLAISACEENQKLILHIKKTCYNEINQWWKRYKKIKEIKKYGKKKDDY